LKAALAYAAAGLYVVPLHTPLFDSTGACIGCSCEAYKRSAKCQEWLESKGLSHRFDAAFKCPTPGKHPRLSEWENAATTDADIIRAWFARWTHLNIGIAPGKSGLLVVDGDKYKDEYAGENLLTFEDEQTATALSGGGGQHLYYQMPVGATYGNQTGALPAGVDIRAHGGMVVVSPSIHPNGRAYQWETGYSILEYTPRPLPQALAALLDAAQTRHSTVKAVTFTTPNTDAPDVAQWRISPAVRELIHTPPPKGQRSEADAKVITSLCYAGANDDDILAVFEHFPIGTAGKFAERGRDYLALTIGKARAYVSDNPRTARTNVPQTIQAARTWRQTADFAAVVPQEVQGTRGYRTLATDKRLFDGFLDVYERLGTLVAPISIMQLSIASGLSNGSVHRSLCRLLAAGLIRKVDAPQGNDGLAHWYELVVTDAIVSCSNGTVLYLTECGTTIPFEQLTLTKHKTDDAYQRGGSKSQREKATIKAIGADGLLAVDVLADYGSLIQAQIGALTKQSKSTISRVIARLELFGVVTVEKKWRERVVTLATDWQDKVLRLTPQMPTYGNKFRRELSAHLNNVQNCDRQMARGVGDKAKVEDRRKLAVRLALDMQTQESAQKFSTERQKEIVQTLHRHYTHARVMATLPKNVRTLPIISTVAQKTVAPWFKQNDGLGDKRMDEIMCDLGDNEALADAREQMRAIGVNHTPTTEPAAQVPFLASASAHAVRMAQLGF
jgi:predicted transcriptional regulator